MHASFKPIPFTDQTPTCSRTVTADRVFITVDRWDRRLTVELSQDDLDEILNEMALARRLGRASGEPQSVSTVEV